MDNVNFELLKLALFWLVGGGGSAVATYFAVERIRPLAELQSEYKRWVSLGLAAVLSMAAYAGAVGLNYVDAPIGWQAWLESLFAVGGLSAGLGQLIHGRAKLSQ